MNWGEAVVVLALVLVNGFFAGSELALMSARKARLRVRADGGHRGARVALQLLENPTRLLSSIQIGITLVGILTGVYSGAVFAEDLATVLRRFDPIQRYAYELAFGTVVVVITYLSLILGELVPKRVAIAHAEAIASFVAIPMTWVAKIAAPLVWVLQVSTDAVTRLLPTPSTPQTSVTEDELRAMIAAGTLEGVFQLREKELIEGVLRLADRSVESVMVPRGDVIWLDANEPLEKIWEEARASGHSRFPLCDGELEQLIGVITIADLGEALRRGRLDRERDVRPPLHVPRTLSVLRLLDVYRESGVHFAIVTGEYGEIEGLVVPVDVLRAIAGALPERGGVQHSSAIRRADGSWLLDGQFGIHELERLLGRNDLAHADDYHTVAGFILWRLGRLPVAGEGLDWQDLRFEVVDMDGPRIDKVLVMQRAAQEVSARES